MTLPPRWLMGWNKQLTSSLDFAWLFVCLVLVVVMQAGFAAYEVGTIRTTTSSSILKKNLGDASVSLCAWALVGYGLARGEDRGGFVGTSYFLLWRPGKPFEATEERDTGSLFLDFVFRWSFAATCTTIVSGAVADRMYVKAYFIYAFLTAALFYPLLAHAVWADEGWASPLKTEQGQSNAFLSCGVVDFAGSGVVHMLGGGISLVMAKMVKNRPDRFIDANKERATPAGATRYLFTFFERLPSFQRRSNEPPSKFVNLTGIPQLNESGFRPNDPSWMTLGCFLLWIGWYGFNCGSTFKISTEATRNTAGRAAMNTTIGAAVGSVSSMIMEVIYHQWSPNYRRGKRIKDPSQLEGVENKQQTKYDYEKDHKSGFRWPLSTHKDIHVAGCNGILVGLVGITAGCATMDPWPAIGVSSASALVYHIWYRAILCCRIDDAVNSAAVHLFGGFWGLVAAGFTVVDSARRDLGYPDEGDNCTRKNQFLANLSMAAIISCYSLCCGCILWLLFKFVFKISEKIRDVGHDHLLEKEMDPDVENVDNKLVEFMADTYQRLNELEKSFDPCRRQRVSLRGSGEEDVKD